MKRTDGKYGGGSRERDRIAVRHTRRRIGGISLGLRRPRGAATMLLGVADNLLGARVLEDRFSAAQMSIALPKGRPAALAYVSEFVEQSKKSGTVSRAIETAKLRGVSVAP
jgi:hypothetical protein